MLAYRSYAGARTYFRAVAIIYGLLTVLGLLPATNTTFGLIPIYGNDVWLHALIAAGAAYFGWYKFFREEPQLGRTPVASLLGDRRSGCGGDGPGAP